MTTVPLVSMYPQCCLSVSTAASPSENADMFRKMGSTRHKPERSIKPHRPFIRTAPRPNVNLSARSKRGEIRNRPDGSAYPHNEPARTGSKVSSARLGLRLMMVQRKSRRIELLRNLIVSTFISVLVSALVVNSHVCTV